MLLKKNRDTERQQPQTTDIPFVTALCSPLANLELQEREEQFDGYSLPNICPKSSAKPKSRDRENWH
jgi:hypothetical protein